MVKWLLGFGKDRRCMEIFTSLGHWSFLQVLQVYHQMKWVRILFSDCSLKVWHTWLLLSLNFKSLQTCWTQIKKHFMECKLDFCVDVKCLNFRDKSAVLTFPSLGDSRGFNLKNLASCRPAIASVQFSVVCTGPIDISIKIVNFCVGHVRNCN